MKVTAGSQIGPYQVVEQVGRGGMATVFKAYQPALERMVAIKVLPDFLAEDPEFRERFRREAVAIAKLRHPNILAVFDHGEIEGQPYIVTEFVEGGTFAAELGKPVGLPRALDVLRSVASALDYAHQRGILHRDVKPSNILVTKDGTSVLGDFGLARMMATNERLARFDMVVGTPEYMSPEQCAGTETGPASDQYALGVVAFEALTGHVPYHAETPAAVMLAQMQAPLPMARTVNPGLPVAVERALMRALAKEPGDRYPNCTAFIEALTDSSTEVAAVPSPSRAAPATTAISPPKARSAPAGIAWRPARQPMVIGAAAVAVLLLLGGVAYAISRASPGTFGLASAGPAHGSLIYDAHLSKSTWAEGEPSPDPAGSAAFGYGSAIDIRLDKDSAFSGEFDAPALKNYVAHLVFRVDPGSDFEIDWHVRGAGPNEKAEVFLDIEVAQEAMTLYFSPYEGDNQAMAATIPVPGLQSGRTIDLGLVVNGTSISMYLGDRRVAQVTESRSTGATTPGFYLNGKSGTMHIQSLRYYAVP